jgi:hypothetical protein
MTEEIRVVDRRTWQRVPPEPPSREAAIRTTTSEQFAAAQRRWAEIVDLDDPPRPTGGATSVRSEPKLVCTEAQRRRRLAKRLARVRQSLAHCLADAQVCGHLSAFEQDGISEDVEVIRGHLHTLLRDVLFNA